MLEDLLPREKALKLGIETLTDKELLCLIIGSGTKNRNVFEISNDILEVTNEIMNLQSITIEELYNIKGISNAKALLIIGIIELSKRFSNKYIQEKNIVNNPDKIAKYLNIKYANLKQEHFIGIFLDSNNSIIKDKVIFKGGLNYSIVHPRELFNEAIKLHSAKLIIAHNHPSGNVQPSGNDIEQTIKILDSSYIIGIPLIDHIIFGCNNYYSFKDNKLIDFKI